MNLLRILLLSTLLAGAAVVQADTSRYEVTLPMTSTNFQFPGLDLHEVSKIKLTLSTSQIAPGFQVNRMEMVFPYANNLIVNNFKENGSILSANVGNRWVFRRLIVEADFSSYPAKPVTGDQVTVSVYVATADFFNNQGNSSPQGELLVTARGEVVNVTHNPAADTHWMKVDNKGLSLKLYQRPENNMYGDNPGQGFKLDLNWMGHGARTAYLSTPFNVHEYGQFKAVALNVITQAGPDGDEYFLEIVYEDEMGSQQTANVGDLRSILSMAYPF